MSWIPQDDTRTQDQLREHYLVEKELAGKLRNAPKKERGHLYSTLYNELYQKVPHHSQLLVKNDAVYKKHRAEQKMKLVKKFLKPEVSIFLEIGSGDLSFTQTIAPYVALVYAVDVSSEIGKDIVLAQNIQTILSDGTSIPVPEKSVHLAYSNQLMEHCHPDDAFEQLKNIYKALAENGVYICITPNALSGPHDISQYFSDTAEGFHLKEYTLRELLELFRSIGFKRFWVYAGGLGFYIRVPLFFVGFLENVLEVFPKKMRRSISRLLPFKAILGLNFVAGK